MADDDWTPDFGSLDAAAPPWAAKRPVRIAVLGDFSAGAAAGRLETGDDLARRKMIPVEFDTLEDTLARLEVKLALPIGEGGDGVELEFGELDSFHPDTLYRELPMFKALAELSKRLNNTATFAKAAAEVQAMAGGPKRRASRSGARRSQERRARRQRQALRLCPAGRHRPGGQRRHAGRRADEANHRRRSCTKSPDPKRDSLVAVVDNALSDAMRTVLHQSEFQNLEALWRGMDMILRRIETGPSLQVLLVDVSAEEFAADLSGAQRPLRDRPLLDARRQAVAGQERRRVADPAASTSSSRRRRTPSCSAAWRRSPSSASAPFVTSINERCRSSIGATRRIR